MAFAKRAPRRFYYGRCFKELVMIKLRGAFTALVTPMRENGEVNYDEFRRLINFQIDKGINGLVPLGTTGETPTLNGEEKDLLIKITVEETKGRVPIIAGAGSYSTRETIENIKRVKDLGADVAMVVTPYYNRPNDAGLVRHFEESAKVGIPIMIYNIASRTGRNIPAVLVKELAKIPGIVALKESSGDINQIEEIIYDNLESGNDSLSVLSGDDAIALPLLALGGCGVVSVISNLFPSEIVALAKAGLEGNFAECRRIHYKLLPFMKAAFVETNPIPIKTAMTWAGLPGGPVRLPLAPISKKSEEILRSAMQKVGMN
jgi:4-hydroxy-tetrahydrodipicolinate synthase